MEDLFETLFVVLFIVIALAVNIVQMAKRKKMQLPLPEPMPSSEFFSEVEPQPQIKLQIAKGTEELKIEKPVIEIPEVSVYGFSRDELEYGIILSTILGPPKSLSKRKLSRS